MTAPRAGPAVAPARPATRIPARLALGALGGLLAALAWWWTHPPDPAAELLARDHALARLERVPAPELGAGLERWRLIGARGDTATAWWRPARLPAGRSPWTVVLLGGIGTDERAALLVPDSLPAGVLAVHWPWRGPRRMGAFAFLARLPRIREALLASPGAVALAIAAARRAEPGARIALVGASLGVPPAVAALSLARPDAVVLVDGAADLPLLLRSEIARALGGGAAAALLAPPASALGARLTYALEPARHAVAPGVPVLLVDAARDERYPRACVARLHATFPGASARTHPGGHFRPSDRRALAAVVGISWHWLEGLPAAR